MKSYAELDLEPIPLLGEETAGTRQRLRDARAIGPIAKGPIGPLVIRHAAVTELLHDKRLRGVQMDLARLSGIPEDSRTWRRQQNVLLFMEGERHHRLRRLVAKAFTPRAVEALRPYTRSVIGGLIDAVYERKRCDAVAALTDPFPIPVICALVGIEPNRIDDMSRWAESVLMALRLDAGMHLTVIEQSMAELDAYIDGLIDARRKSPRDDLLSRLIAVEEEGDKLSRDELQAVVATMLVAGTDTTRNQLANVIHTFCEYPDQWALLRARPDLVSNAIEEAIRWQPATQAVPRVAIEDVVVDDIVIPAGTVVLLSSLSANHDDRALPGADRFDITREAPDGWQLLTFGGGVHYCLGANLARLELTEALDVFAMRFVTLCADGEPELSPMGSPIRGYQKLPIAWT